MAGERLQIVGVPITPSDIEGLKDLLLADDATIKDYLVVEGSLSTGELKTRKSILVQDDATIKGHVMLEGPVDITGREFKGHDLDFRDGIFRDDATVKDHLRVDRLIETRRLRVARMGGGSPLIIEGVGDDATFKGQILIERPIRCLGYNPMWTCEMPGMWIQNGLVVQADATVKNFMRVEGHLTAASSDIQPAAHDHDWSEPIFEDTTVKSNIRVEGFLDVIGSHNITAAPHDHNYTSPIFQDATIKDDLRIDGNLQFESAGLFVTGDATVKDDLHVDGLIFGTLSSDVSFPAHDHNYSSPIFQDATVKDDLHVDGESLLTGVTVNDDILVLQDATIKGDIRLEGMDHGFSGGAGWTEPPDAPDFIVGRNLTVQNDATVKGNLTVEGAAIPKFTTSEIEAEGDEDLVIRNGASPAPEIRFAGPNEIRIDPGPPGSGYEDGAQINLQRDTWVWRELIVYQDATVKGNIYLEGSEYGFDPGGWSPPDAPDFIVGRDLIVQDDATIHDELQVGDRIILVSDGQVDLPAFTFYVDTDTGIYRSATNEISLAAGGNQGLVVQSKLVKIPDDLIVYDDATVKGDLLIDGHLQFESSDLSVSRDATIKGNLYVEGFAYGTYESSAYSEGDSPDFQDMFIRNDLLIWHDATVKGDIYLEGRSHGIDHDQLDNFVVNEHRAMDDDATSSVTLWSSSEIHWRLKDLADRLSGAGGYSEGDSPDFQDLFVRKDLLVQDDATVKDWILANKIDAEVVKTKKIKGKSPLVIQADATFAGSLTKGIRVEPVPDFRKDITIRRDATVKQTLYVEDRIFMKPNKYGAPNPLILMQGNLGRWFRIQQNAQDNLQFTGNIGQGGYYQFEGGGMRIRWAPAAGDMKDVALIGIDGRTHWKTDATFNQCVYIKGSESRFQAYDHVNQKLEHGISEDFISGKHPYKIVKGIVVESRPYSLDSTVKGMLRVEGHLTAASSDITPAAHDHNWSSPIFSDTTIKQNLSVEDRLYFGEKGAYISGSSGNDIDISNDLILTSGGIAITQGNVAWAILTAQVSGDGVSRVSILPDGKIEWGSGAANRDTYLERQSAHTLKTGGDFIVQQDTTVKQDFYLEGNLFAGTVSTTTLWAGSSIITGGGIVIQDDLLVWNDATVKDHLRVEGPITSNSWITSTVRCQAPFGVFVLGLFENINVTSSVIGDLLVYDDATVKGDLRIDGLIAVDNIMVRDDIIVRDDATIKGDLVVEGGRGNLSSINFVFDGGGAEISDGARGFIVVPYDAIIKKAFIYTDNSTTMDVNVQITNYTNWNTDAQTIKTFSLHQDDQYRTTNFDATRIRADDVLVFQALESGVQINASEAVVSLIVQKSNRDI